MRAASSSWRSLTTSSSDSGNEVMVQPVGDDSSPRQVWTMSSHTTVRLEWPMTHPAVARRRVLSPSFSPCLLRTHPSHPRSRDRRAAWTASCVSRIFSSRSSPAPVLEYRSPRQQSKQGRSKLGHSWLGSLGGIRVIGNIFWLFVLCDGMTTGSFGLTVSQCHSFLRWDSYKRCAWNYGHSYRITGNIWDHFALKAHRFSNARE